MDQNTASIKFTDKDGRMFWRTVDGTLHRTDGPALDFPNEKYQAWHIYGKRHRTDGPARVWGDNTYEWWVSGIPYYDNKSYQKAANLTDEDMLMINLKYGDVK